MRLGGLCITTDNAQRLAEFYRIVFQKEPFIEGNHYTFDNLAIYDPGDVQANNDKTIWLQCFDRDIDALYARLLREIPNISIISPPIRRPWGAYSFQFSDPDGNNIAVAQES